MVVVGVFWVVVSWFWSWVLVVWGSVGSRGSECLGRGGDGGVFFGMFVFCLCVDVVGFGWLRVGW